MSMPSAVRHINETRVLQELFREGPLSRAELSRRLVLTRSTAGSLVTHLVEQGFVEEGTGDTGGDGRTGRPGLLVSLKADAATFLGAEIGVEKITLLAMDLRGNVVSTSTTGHGAGNRPEDAVDTLRQAIDRFRSDREPSHRIEGLCVTVPGLLRSDGLVLSTPILGWADTDLLSILRDRLVDFGDILVENDANAFATAETYLATNSGTALFILLDAGVGGGLISDGRLVRGHHGYAGEIGHIPIGEQGYTAGLAVPGSFESYVGKGALLNRIVYYGGEAADIQTLAAKFQAGDIAARATVGDWSRWLGRGLAILVATLDPERIVLGGECAVVAELCLEDIEAQLRALLLRRRPVPPVEISRLGRDVAALGAACQLHRNFFSIDSSFVFGACSAA